jgi:hypothetical protein
MKIKSLSQYILEASKFNLKLGLSQSTINPWFRGMKDEKFELVPSIYRDPRLKKCELEIARDFILKAEPFLEVAKPNTKVDWMFLMQHHHLPTRLIDWTENYLAALYFAVNDFKYDEDAIVYILNPWEMNMEHLGEKSIINPDNPILNDYIMDKDRNIIGKEPIAIRPSRNSKRLVAQRVFFTLHGMWEEPLDSYRHTIDCLIIDKEFKLSIMKELYQAGITSSSMFPELDQISQEIVFTYTEFMSEDLTQWSNPKNFSRPVQMPTDNK